MRKQKILLLNHCNFSLTIKSLNKGDLFLIWIKDGLTKLDLGVLSTLWKSPLSESIDIILLFDQSLETRIITQNPTRVIDSFTRNIYFKGLFDEN